MEAEGSLPHLQGPATCSYPEPDQSSSHLPILRIEDPFQYYPPFYAKVFKVVLIPQVSPPNTLYTPLLSSKLTTYPAHLILFDLTTRITFGDQYRS